MQVISKFFFLHSQADTNNSLKKSPSHHKTKKRGLTHQTDKTMAPLNEETVLSTGDNAQDVDHDKPVPPTLSASEEPTEDSKDAEEREQPDSPEEAQKDQEDIGMVDAVESNAEKDKEDVDMVDASESKQEKDSDGAEMDTAIESTLNFMSCCALPDRGVCSACKKQVTIVQSSIQLDDKTYIHKDCEKNATKIQAKVRANMARGEAQKIRDEKQEEAAVKLQTKAKEFLKKKEAAASKETEETAAQEVAAQEVAAQASKKSSLKYRIRQLFSGCKAKSSTTAAVNTEAHKVEDKNASASSEAEEVEEASPESTAPQEAV